MSKVLIIGLDGATMDVLRPLAEAGRLPHLKRMLDEGAWGTLQSAVPPITPTAWTSVFTGKNPGKHGIYDFQAINPDTYKRRPVRVDQHQEKTLWDLLGESDKRSIVVDVPYTYPPRPLNGLMLTGYGTPRTAETIFTHPADWRTHLPGDLHDEIRVGLPRHRFDRSQALIDEWGDVMHGRRRLLTHLLREEKWDFFFTVFNITDNMGHIFWTFIDPTHPNYHKSEGAHFREAFFNAYEQCDTAIGEMLAQIDDDTTVLIMSDHGFGSIHTRQYIFQRLVDGGFIQYETGRGGSWRGALIKQLIRTYNQFPRLREWLKGLRPDRKKTLGNSLRQAGLMPDAKAIDYSKSIVLPTDFGLQMWINSDDRFAHGSVKAADKTAVLDRLAAHLLADRDPHTGQPIITNVYRGTDLYTGTHAAAGPDLVLEFNNFYQPNTRPATHRNPNLEGGHTQEGIFLAWGAHIKPGRTAAGLIDLAPTTLHLMGEPIPPDMDGRVLTDILDAAHQQVTVGEQPATWAESMAGDGYTAEEEEELLAQLRQLGYVE